MTSPSDKSEFVEHLKNSSDKDSIWFYFLREKNGNLAKCKNENCKQILKTGGGSTSTQHTHLESKHEIVIRKSQLSSPQVRNG